MTKRILFISWDGAQTSYAEGLFMPIFNEIQNHSDFKFHYIQFSNANKEKVDRVKQEASKLSIAYKHIQTEPFKPSSLSQIYSLLNGHKILKKYIEQNGIQYLFPRSYFPAYMVNKLNTNKLTVFYDADGLPADERVDFQGLSKDSFRYKFSLKQENKIMKTAKHIFTRSQKSIQVHLERYSSLSASKFSTISNGRDVNVFAPSNSARSQKREALNIANNELLFTYAGSLGQQYGWNEMVTIVKKTAKQQKVKWLILTGDTSFVDQNLPEELKSITSYFRVPFSEVPQYLNAADIGFAIRQPSFSMQGVAPIKLGEYFLIGLPTIASKGIGDSDLLVKNAPESFLFDHSDNNNINDAVAWIQSIDNKKITDKISAYGKKNFSIQASAKEYLQYINKF